MKKATWLFSSVIAALLATGAPAVVSAEGDGANNISSAVGPGFVLEPQETQVEANSTAQIEVSVGPLSLVAVPNLHFEDASVKDLIDGPKRLQLEDGNLSGTPTTYDGNDQQKIQVDDYRGTNADWTLTASLTDFKDGEKTLNISDLTLKGSTSLNKSTGASLDTTFKDTGIVLSAGTGSTEASLSNETTLNLPQTANPLAGNYQAEITWTLNATPNTDTN